MTEYRHQERLSVRLPDGRSYPIVLGGGLLDTDALLDPFVGSQVLLVSNPVVAEHYLDRVRERLSVDRMVDVVLIGDGERFKTLDTYASILDTLIAKRHSRATTVVALGGGVVGDVAGFAAATYQRGVGLVQIPTTLLAQVDSSVGGKTAVNHATGKNLIGAFYQPRAVIADVDVLATLPEREFRAGLAEVVKYGVIADALFFSWLERSMDALLRRESAPLIEAVRRSCEIKADVVADDEREQGRRAILNFGHTFGHAIEAQTGYSAYLHGEAVAIGMAIAASLSERLGRMPRTEVERLLDLLRRAGLPVAPAGIDAQAVLTTMGMDKKALDGRIRLVLCDGLGSVSVTADTPSGMIVDAIRDAGGAA